MSFGDYEQFMLALCLYREARGETSEAKRAVAWTVRNRVMNPRWWGKSWVDVIIKPFQFSSFNHNDPNVAVWPKTPDAAWLDCLTIASEVHEGHGSDPSGGASHYYDDSRTPPEWSIHMKPTVKIGRLNFFKL